MATKQTTPKNEGTVMAQNTASISLEDYDGERSSTNFNPGPLTSVNFDAKRAGLAALQSAIAAITLGEVRATNFTIVTQESVAVVTNRVAQRESKWLVTYRDVTQFFDVANTIANVGYGKLFTVEIPTADLSLLPATNSDELDLTQTAVAAFVTAFEAFQNSPTGGNDIDVVSIRHVGRRN